MNDHRKGIPPDRITEKDHLIVFHRKYIPDARSDPFCFLFSGSSGKCFVMVPAGIIRNLRDDFQKVSACFLLYDLCDSPVRPVNGEIQNERLFSHPYSMVGRITRSETSTLSGCDTAYRTASAIFCASSPAFS